MTKFNAAEYRSDFNRLMQMNPGKAADAATAVARRKVNAEKKGAAKAEQVQRALGYVSAVPVTAIVGAVEGSLMAKREALIVDWEERGAALVGADLAVHPTPFTHEKGVADPQKLFGVVPTVLVAPVFFSLLAVGLSMKKRKKSAGMFFERMATNVAGQTIAFTAAAWSYSGSFRASRKKLESKELSSLREEKA